MRRVASLPPRDQAFRTRRITLAKFLHWIPDILGHRQSDPKVCGQRLVRRNAHALQCPHQLPRVLAAVPRRALIEFMPRDIAIIDVGLRRPIARRPRLAKPLSKFLKQMLLKSPLKTRAFINSLTKTQLLPLFSLKNLLFMAKMEWLPPRILWLRRWAWTS